ncbi:MAG: terminase large subunit [Burkholderiales bacterium]|nr:terminase large subunit [Burkholderiales bacterium]
MIARYCDEVRAGAIPAGKFARLAVERHLRDRERELEDDFPYRFDEATAAAFLAGCERWPHVKGAWAKRRERIRLEPWQAFVLGAVMGWLRKDDGLRRFRELYLEVPRKNSKSTMDALIGLHMLFDDGEHHAEVYAGATTERQAHEVFSPARLMLERSPEIRVAAGLEVWSKSLVRPEDNSRFWPVVGKPGDGASPSCAIVDEYHEHLTSELLDTMVSGMGAREQPLLIVSTTAGTDLASPCRDKHDEVRKVLEGVVENDELFGVIYSIDEGDDWTDPEVLRKANPNFGISVDEEFLLAQQRQAIANPASQVRFRTKHLNEWCSASVSGINMAAWRACADPTLKLEQFRGQPCRFALDLASKLDVCAFVQLFARQVDGTRHYYAFGKYYLPEDTINEARANAAAYAKWVAAGHLIATDGAEIDFDHIRDEVLALKSMVQVEEIIYDPWRATHLAHQLMAGGATTVEFPQGNQFMAPAFDELNAALASGRFHHDGNPVLEWMASNVVAKTVTKGLVIPAKEANRPDQKIDGVIALCMALARANVPAPAGGSIDDWLADPI